MHRLLATLALLLTSACASAPRDPDALLVDPGARLDTVAFETNQGTRLAFDLSPDGRTIVFDLLGQLWLLPSEGGEARSITDAVRDTAEDLDPVLSPDGRSIVFWSDRPGGKGLWLRSLEDGDLRPLVIAGSAADQIRSPAWSPDGSRIAFVRRDTIRVLDLGSREVRSLRIEGLPAPPVRDPVWSPDGRKVAFANARAWALGGRIYEVDGEGGTAVPLIPEGMRGRAPAYSPGGDRLAFIAYDSARQAQVWVQERGADTATRLTEHADLTPTRVRWTPDGASVLYSADGALWRRDLAGDMPEKIPFAASLRFARAQPALYPVRFPAAGVELPARGHMGLAISPGGDRIGLLALGRLWIFPLGSEPRAIAPVPPTASGLAWSPDGRTVVWSAGPGGAEDLFVTDLATGTARQLTALPGREEHPSWSPDGRHVAFLHWEKPVLTTPRSEYKDSGPRLRVISIGLEPVARTEEARDLGEVPSRWRFRMFGHGQEAPQWSPGSDALLLFGDGDDGTGARVVPLEGEPRPLAGFPAQATFVRWGADSSLVFVRENLLWRTRIRGDSGRVEEPVQLAEDAALYPSVSRDGAVLFLSSDGLRLRTPEGQIEHMGWPLSYRTPAAPRPLLVRSARIVDGTGAPPSALSDILVEDGRIARIAPAGELVPRPDTDVVEAGGRVALPGLIDLHGHGWDDAVLPASLYFGITTLRDMGSPIGRMAALRDGVRAGVVQGPRIVLGGFQFYPGPDNAGLSGANIQIPGTPEAAERGLALARALGAEYAKMRYPSSLPAGALFVRQAHAAGMRVGGHCVHPLPLLAAGIDGKEHLGTSCEDRSDEVLYGDMVELFRATGITVTPTIEGFANVPRVLADTTGLDHPEVAPFVSPFSRWWTLRLPANSASTYDRFARTARAATGTLHRAGVTIAAGADVPTIPGSLHQELEELVRSGLSPLEAIAAATGTAARVLGAEAEIGTIGPGKWADFVILDADPTEDIRNTRQIWRVIQGGRTIDRPALLERSRK